MDQLAQGWLSNAINWLPARLAPHCRMILTARAEPDLMNYELRLHPGRRLPQVPAGATEEQLHNLANPHLVKIGGLDPVDGEAALTQFLDRAGRRLIDRQRRVILDGFARHGLPLWLKLAADTAIGWPSWATPEDLPADVFGLIQSSLERLGDESRHGHKLVATALGYLAAAYAGLTEGELLDLLSLDTEVLAAFCRRAPDSPAVGRLPTVIWSRLHADLEPYLQERLVDHTLTYNFFHREFAEVVSQLYLDHGKRSKFERRLADYFDDPQLQPVFLDQAAWEPNRRRLTQLPASAHQ